MSLDCHFTSILLYLLYSLRNPIYLRTLNSATCWWIPNGYRQPLLLPWTLESYPAATWYLLVNVAHCPLKHTGSPVSSIAINTTLLYQVPPFEVICGFSLSFMPPYPIPQEMLSVVTFKLSPKSGHLYHSFPHQSHHNYLLRQFQSLLNELQFKWRCNISFQNTVL